MEYIMAVELGCILLAVLTIAAVLVIFEVIE
jgi:hypothetical protein